MTEVRPVFKVLRGVIFVFAVVVAPLSFLAMAIKGTELSIWLRFFCGAMSIPALIIGLEVMKLFRLKKGPK